MGSFFVIASSCVFNNYIDKDIDKIMQRTCNRPFALGNINYKIAFLYGFILGIAGFWLLIFFVNFLAFFLAFLGFFIYVFLYTLVLKRKSYLSTLVGSLSGAIPPLLGFVAVKKSLSIFSLLLFLVLFFWQLPHFYSFALLKIEDYRKACIPMLPVVKGFEITKHHIFFFTLCLFLVNLLGYFFLPMTYFFLIVSLILNSFFLYLSLKGYFVKNIQKWSRETFLYSLVYLIILLSSFIIDKILYLYF